MEALLENYEFLLAIGGILGGLVLWFKNHDTKTMTKLEEIHSELKDIKDK